MTAADVSIVVLLGLFALSLLPRLHLGIAAFAASFVVAQFAGITTEQLTGFFPSDFFVLIVGVMCLYGIVQLTGAMDWIFTGALALVGGRVRLIPLLVFAFGALLTGVGTLPAASVAIVAPVALGLARRFALSAFMMSLVALTGIVAGLLSPVAVFGLTAAQLMERAGFDVPDSAGARLALSSLAVGVVTTLVLLVLYRKDLGSAPTARTLPATERPGVDGLDGAPLETATRGNSPVASPSGGGGILTAPAPTMTGPVLATTSSSTQKVLALIGLVGTAGGSILFDLNIGYLAFCAALVLQLVLRLEPASVLARVPWGVLLLIGGLLTYIGLMQELGAFARMSELLSVDGSPLISLLVVCYIAGVTSFFASSIAVFVAAMPLVPPLVAEGLDPVSAVLAVALSSVLVDINPLGITGGLILGAAEPDEREALFRKLLTFGICAVIVAPGLSWAVFAWW